MPTVFIAAATLANRHAPQVAILREAGFDLVYPSVQRQLLEEELLQSLKGVSATIAGMEPYTRRVLDAHPQLRVIARAGVGYDAVDMAAANDHAVAVCITPGTNQDAVAEHTFTLILACAKSLVPQHQGTRAGTWPRSVTLPLRGRALGIAGLGRIGKAVAERGAAFKMRLLAFEPYPDHDFVQKYHVELVPWDRLLAESDYLSLHIPLTPESRHVINKDSLAKMKPTAFLINTARGGLVSEKDLLAALQAGKLAGAGLDVFEKEPPPPSLLYEMDNVVLTPHAAGVDLQSRDDMAISAARAIVVLHRGEWPAEQVVNPVIRARFRW
jgi:phosphoglycerate dehydrogenase-like enzyme